MRELLSDGRAEAGRAFLQMQSRHSHARPVPVNCLACSVSTVVLFGVAMASGALHHIPSVVPSDFCHSCDSMNLAAAQFRHIAARLIRDFSQLWERPALNSGTEEKRAE